MKVSFHLWTGVVQTAALLDYENIKSHQVTVRARDPKTGIHSDAQITISLTDANDNPPRFTRDVYRGQISEAAVLGQVVLQVGLRRPSMHNLRVQLCCAKSNLIK